MASKNGNGQQAVAAAPAKRVQITNRIRKLINDNFDDSSESGQKAKKEVLAYINGLVKNQKPAG